MNKIDSLQALSALITPQLKRGLVTNAPLSTENFRTDITAGNLYVSELPQALLLFKKRDGFDRLSFYLQQGATLQEFRPQNTTVTEIAYRTKDTALKDSQSLFEGIGFTRALERRRLTLSPTHIDLTCPFEIKDAEMQHFAQLSKLLQDGFSPLTGCLPTESELQADIATGNVLIATDGENIAGLLHICRTPRATEYRHVLTAPSYRGRGIMQSMLAYDINKALSPTYMLWVATDNTPALHLYQKLGFAPDGWNSTVWIYQ